MRKSLLSVVCAAVGIISSHNMQAQIKGDPSFDAKPQQINLQKTSSAISPDLQRLYDNSSGARKTQLTSARAIAPNDAMNKFMQISGNGVVVDVTVKDNISAATAALQQLGFRVTGTYGRVISGIIPINALPQLSAISSVQFARAAYKPMHQGKNVNAFTQYLNNNLSGKALPVPVISQGDTAQRSYIARKKYNVTGKGIKVGVLSDSYNNLGTASVGVAHGELPGPGNPFGYKKPVDVLEDLDSTGTDEGRAMAEIVHDVAPGADLAFHTAFNGEADFAQGIQDLATKGCKVIVDDVIYFSEPFFQDGIIAQSVDKAKKRGVTYFSSAGNYYNSSYESDYQASTQEVLGAGNGTAHNFSAPGATPRYFQPIYIPTNGTFVASFQWDQPFFSAGGAGTNSDLDIYLLDLYGNIVAAGATDNLASGDPLEIFGYNNFTVNHTFFLVILKYAGPDPTHIKYNMYDDAQFYLTNPAIPGILAPTLVGHAKADGAVATGAAFYLNTPAYGVDTPKVEWYSSLGGVANYFDLAGNRVPTTVRRKPEIVAPDGGNTSFFYSDISQDSDTFPNFFGTSAAAPHAAGVAALMIEATKLNNITPAQIKGVLSANTVDMDNIYTPGFDKGFDFNTGTGLIKADGAVGDVRFPNLYIKDLNLKPVCSVNPSATRSWKIINPNPFEVEAHWFVLGTNQHGTITAWPGETTFSTNTLSFGNYQVPNIVILDWDDNFGFTRLDIENSIKSQCGSSSRTMEDETDAAALAKPMIAEVFPNPATTTFRVYLALADQQQISMQLYSIDGKQLLTQQVGQTKGIVSIDATRYKPGVYLLQIKQGTFSKTIKLIKQ